MKDEFVTLETAKALKDKGFDWKCNSIITIGGTIRSYESPQDLSYLTEIEGKPYEFLLPALHLAQKWLREIRGVYVYVEPVIGKRWKLSFCDFNVPTEESDWMENEINKGNGYKVYVTYEEALEAGIQEVLKLI